MKKIYIQFILVLLTIFLFGVTAFYYWQSLKIITFSNDQKIINNEMITAEIIPDSFPIFYEEITSPPAPLLRWEEIEDNGDDSEVTKILPFADLYNDSSIQKFIGTQVSFSDVSYIPENLENFSWPYVIDAKWNGQMRKEALENFEKLSQSFYADFSEKIVVVSSYRSYAYQKWIKDRGCPDNLCAKAWYSEHQSWLAVDFWEASTNSQFLGKTHLKKYYEWLMENASLYWFHNSYQKGKSIDWYDREPWHWRYLWEWLATYLDENNLTLTEFYNLQLQDEA